MALKSTSSVHEISKDKPPFGSRFLTTEDDVWSQNAWDHVPPPDDQGQKIAQSLERQRSNPVPSQDKAKYNEKPAKHWDNFYKSNENNFFKDRKWLHNEFPELINATKPEAGAITIAEIGCGAGNSVFPLLSSNRNPSLRLHAYDYSSHAVKLVQNHPQYLEPSIGSISASVWDLTSANGLPPDIQPGAIDIIILVFVLSALHPDEWGRAVNNIHQMLKPGGVVLLRDYGRYDLAQLRFKGGRLLEENFYIRGDKTRVYFFDLGEHRSVEHAPSLLSCHTHAQNPDLWFILTSTYAELDELSLIFTGTKPSPESTTVTTTTTELASETGGGQDVNSETKAHNEVDGTMRLDMQFDQVNSDGSGPVLLDSCKSTIHDSLDKYNDAMELEVPNDRPSALGPTNSYSSVQMSPISHTESPIHCSLLPSQPSGLAQLADCPPHPMFETESLGIDRRLIVNRKRKVKMYRVWMQGKFRKI